MKRKRLSPSLSVPEKANRILNGLLVVLILITVRIWHLAVIQHQEKLEDSRKPQRKVIVEKAERATIHDRFGMPLAINKVQYNAAISYGEIRDIPRCIWKRNEQGKKIKIYKRKEYIRSLSQLLGRELKLEPERIEDLIHAKASIFGSVPFVIKENISESEYFRLCMLEKDWMGIRAEQVAKREYPEHLSGGEVIGYLGAMGKHEYDSITSEMKHLRECIHLWEENGNYELPKGYKCIDEVIFRLTELESKAYTINDYVGKTGIEGVFEEQLRGFRGKKTYLLDIKGNYLEELPGSIEPMPGKRLNLTLCLELQKYAEALLAESEQTPPSKSPQDIKRRLLTPDKQPWIKGGAIVVMDPNQGDILALASYPRFDPNDFIRSGDKEENEKKREHIHQWLENENHLKALWDQKIPLTRERIHPLQNNYYEEEEILTWENYLQLILPNTSLVKQTLEKENTLYSSFKIQYFVDRLLALFEQGSFKLAPSKIIDAVYDEAIPIGLLTTLDEKDFLNETIAHHIDEVLILKEKLKPFFQHLKYNKDKLILTDLYRLIIDEKTFPISLLELVGEESISNYRQVCAHTTCLLQAFKEIVRDLFQEHHFKEWKEKEFKNYLAEKRKEEEKKKIKYAKPYIEYLDEAENQLFKEFWAHYQWGLLLTLLTGEDPFESDLKPYLECILTWRNEIKAGAHSGLWWVHHFLKLENSLRDLSTPLIIPYLKTTRSFSSLNRPLLGSYVGIRSEEGKHLEKHLASAFYPLYGYGYARSQAFRQAATVGSIFKLIPAYEALYQRYSILKDQNESKDLNPLVMVDDKQKNPKGEWIVGFTAEGKPIPTFYKGGRLPKSDHFHLGKLDLIRALEVSSNPYFSLLSGELIHDPEDLCKAARQFGYGSKTGIELVGEIKGNVPEDVLYDRSGLYSLSIGQHSLVGTPLQTAVMLSALANGGKVLKPQIIYKKSGPSAIEERTREVRWEIDLPPSIRHLLLTGMKQVIMGEKGTARFLQRQFSQDFLKTIVGKTSTAESMERVSLDAENGVLKMKHVWFGAISFDPTGTTEYEKPEIVVVVYFKLAGWGKDAAPYAAKMIKKYRELFKNEN